MNRRIFEINDIGQLPFWTSQWDQLHARTSAATFFQTWEWLAVTWKHFPRPQKLRLLVILENEEPIGFVPFCVREQNFRVGALRVLSYPLEDWGPFFGPIGCDSVECFRLAIEHVLRSDRDWDVVDLRYLCEQSAGFAEMDKILTQQSRLFFRRPRMEAPVIELAGTWEEYIGRQSKNWRRNMRREQSRVADLGDLQFVRYRTQPESGEVDPRYDLFEDCLCVSQKSWQAKSSLGAAFCSPAVRPVLRELHEVACRRGMIDMNVLYLDERPVAFLYNYLCQREVYALRSGYDADCAIGSLGTVLLHEVVKDSFHRGDRLINLGPGTQDYKKRFAPESRRAINYTYYSPWSLRSQALCLKAALDPLLPGFQERCQKRLVT
ncbi:GNAT family N-acetyltransferase [Blastopirellula sp. J2-11]|uniref:GNAT family N-acetyltransferase n=1 Tax=Blastopirellula sp. J2-11 TaxID=2943192 RepID=UPI0021C9B00C|nr:GNAT family N-acetyltransferase [Blastopirellula sp. J2-11]UUO07233.1 GNAT family N-acetyltransferase [Blastopirellula sp. J2-11]